jgi:kinesin family protein 2/24
MEQFLLENAERFKLLVSRFKPNAAPTKGGSEPGHSSPDILVSARVRPMLEDETDQGFPVGVYLRDGTNTLDLHELKRPVRGLPTISVSLEPGRREWKMLTCRQSFNYTVDRVFGPDATTADIYESLVKPLVPWAWGGGIGTMFAYGQTGSGKTFTVSGLEQLVAETLMDGSLDGERKIHICIIELAGQTAYGKSRSFPY